MNWCVPKSTYCRTMYTHCRINKISVRLVNLDPAAELFEYEPTIDIRELVTLKDVMKDMGLGPNGGLVKCLEIFLENFEWFYDAIGDCEEDYIIIDCPGQIELYTHLDVMKNITENIQAIGYRICSVYLLDSVFLDDHHKYYSGVLSALSSMAQLELPHVNVLSKVDLILPDVYEKKIEMYLNPGIDVLESSQKNIYNKKYDKLTEILAKLISENNMILFRPLNIKLEESLDCILYDINMNLQYYDDHEVYEQKEYNGDD